MHTSDTIGELAASLAKAQGTMTSPAKNKTVKVKTGSGEYEFSYATLDAIFDVIRKPLSDNGLSFVQTLDSGDGGKLRLLTRLLHTSGQWIETETPVSVTGTSMQALGSAQTYAKRYAISALLGIVADEDDDANTADGNGISEKKDRTPPAKQTNAERQTQTAMDAATTWVNKSKIDVKKLRTPEEMAAWWKSNSDRLERLEKEKAALYEDFCAWWDQVRGDLTMGKAA